MITEIMQFSIAASMMVQTGLMLKSVLRTEQPQEAGAPKIAPELKIETGHAKEAFTPPADAGAIRETKTYEPYISEI